MQPQIPLTRDVVLIGGGHAHALVLRMWGMKPVPGVRLTLIDPRPVAPYTGMLPGHVAGHYSEDEIAIDLARLCRFAGARIVLEPAQGLDLRERTVRAGGRTIAYDVVSLDVGITGDLPDVEGFAAHGTPVKPFARFAAGWRRFLSTGAGQAVVIGNGLGGAEVAMAMAHRLGPGRVTVVGGGAVARAGAALNRRIGHEMDRLGVTLVPGRASAVTEGRVVLDSGRALASAFTVGAGGATPQRWLESTGLPLDKGFVEVGPTLQVRGHPEVFAAGDCAQLTHAPRPRAGVYAVRAARVLDRNLRAAVAGGGMGAFRPQRHFLRLVSLGERRAAAEKWPALPVAPAGAMVWRWKDRIDRRFMRKLTELPVMTTPVPRNAARGVGEMMTAAPLCAGCGAKVGAGMLGQVLEGLPQPDRADVLAGPGDDAGILRMGNARQVLTTDHLRAFCADPGLMSRIAAQHALGDVRAMGARAQSALAQIILPRASEALQARMMREIMEAAGEVFTQEGAVILGGHSTMGAELTIGFTVTGLCDGDPVRLDGARAGDALILTGRIGSGVLLAGEMRQEARGADVAALWSAMARGPGNLRALEGAHAMTDVTGFGLAGHLMAICRASGLGAEIDPAAVPLHEGALALAGRGVRSTLYEANRANAPVFGPEDARTALLHDPQTAGGFLAAVAPDAAGSILAGLAADGVPAVNIGHMAAGPVGISVLRG
ncbi:selenide, water dikinase, putative [Pseudooceanicola batsensis HTCC2597]|uniref:Selenide, water dikinase, putative n=1 Tax=Pseudooceanicola batsensis (strain ATCC BAA-863 / DSM 15984 / KCTC 12145 / HTCC2597) TaxID=252305 RepID=A3TTE8_PSEBH|nr:selenide, water dikinase SelD [Pseudooceanicola batsensis]EAQ04925.1 selenide, water dikinase, putative [Pseudooceanicola batsensis HTCC2597]